jgi:hypothetical protein
MKKGIAFAFIALSWSIAVAQNVGIGTNAPKAKLHVSDSSVVFSGLNIFPNPAGNTPIAGSGTRMMWYADKAAFRAGGVTGNYWDKDSIGYYSFATGLNTKALGGASTSMGEYTNANGNYSTSMGFGTTANGNSSTSMGYYTIANGINSTSMGRETNASGIYSTSMGYLTNAGGEASTSMGYGTIASGYGSTSMGHSTTANNNYSTSMGYSTTASGNSATSMGFVTTASGEASTSMGYFTNAGGNYSTSMGRETNATGSYSTSMGRMTTAGGNYSTSMGDNTNASAFGATSMGDRTNASGPYSTSMGSRTTASGYGSTTMGYEAIANGSYSTSMGFTTRAKAYGSFTAGMYNDDTDSPNPVSEASTDRIFQIGNGAFNSKHNAITVLRNGNTGIGTVNPTRPLSFPASLGEKILLYPGAAGEVGIGVYGNELRLHADNPGAKVSFGTQTNAGVFTEAGKFEINGSYALSVFGSIWANGTTYTSDERFKQNITAISSPLQKLLQLNGVEYEMKVNEFPKNHFMPGRQIGLLAQNVEKIIPEAVNEINGYKGVDYARLVPLLIEAVKELKNENDEQQKQIEQLKKIVPQVTKK